MLNRQSLFFFRVFNYYLDLTYLDGTVKEAIILAGSVEQSLRRNDGRTQHLIGRVLGSSVYHNADWQGFVTNRNVTTIISDADLAGRAF